MEATITALDAPPTEKAKLEEKYPDAKLNREPMESGKIRAFRSLTTRDERSRLVRGEFKKTIPRSEWTNEAKDYVDKSIAFIKGKFAEKNFTYDRPDPESITFSYSDYSSNLLPTVWIEIGEVTGWGLA